MPSLEARLVSGTANVVAIANVFEYEQADCRGEGLPCRRVWSIFASNSDSVASWAFAIFFRSLQKASSRLTLVLCPSMATDRLMIKDFIRPPVRLRASVGDDLE